MNPNGNVHVQVTNLANFIVVAFKSDDRFVLTLLHFHNAKPPRSRGRSHLATVYKTILYVAFSNSAAPISLFLASQISRKMTSSLSFCSFGGHINHSFCFLSHDFSSSVLFRFCFSIPFRHRWPGLCSPVLPCWVLASLFLFAWLVRTNARRGANRFVLEPRFELPNFGFIGHIERGLMLHSNNDDR